MKSHEIMSEDTVITDTTTVDEVFRFFNAAKRGLGIANRLRDDADRKRHQRAVMRNINLCRNALMRLTVEIDEMESSIEND